MGDSGNWQRTIVYGSGAACNLAYVNGRPTYATDPSGMSTCPGCDSEVAQGLCGAQAEICAAVLAGIAITESIYDLGKMFGWWGSSFHGSLKPRPDAGPWSEVDPSTGISSLGVPIHGLGGLGAALGGINQALGLPTMADVGCNPVCDANNGANNTNTFGVTAQQQKDCLKAWSDSTLGKVSEFFSLYNLATNLKSLKTLAEWTVLPGGKWLAFSATGKVSSSIGGTEITSVVTGETTTIIAAPVAPAVHIIEKAGGSAAPYGIGAATVLDMSAHAGCMGMNGDAYFQSGQVGVF